MDIIGIDLFDQTVGMTCVKMFAIVCAKVRHRCSWISLTSINLFDLNEGMVCTETWLRYIYMDITGIDLFDQNVSMACG